MVNSYVLQTRHPDETRRLGRKLAGSLSPGTIIGLRGELGSGKTTLIQGICEGLEVKERVVSPTFVLMRVYSGKMPVYHFDLYRLQPDDFADLGWEEYLEGKGITLLEWIDRAEGAFPFPYLEIAIDYDKAPDARNFQFKPRGEFFPWLQGFLESTQ